VVEIYQHQDIIILVQELKQLAGGALGGDSRLMLTNEYDGTIGQAGGNLGTSRSGGGSAGTQTAALAFGGNPQQL
jgi:hypothetical protein